MSPGKWRTLQGPHRRPVRRPPDTVATGRVVGDSESAPVLEDLGGLPPPGEWRFPMPTSGQRFNVDFEHPRHRGVGERL